MKKRSEIRFQGHEIKEMIEKIYKRKQRYYGYNNVSKLKFKDIRCLFSIFVKGEDTLIHSTSQEDHEYINGYNFYV